MNVKSTKHSMIMSVLALLLCCAMLIGVTYAWFSDRSESGKNQVVVGKLHVGLN